MTMTRNDFITWCTGACSCAGLAVLAGPPVEAQTAPRDIDRIQGKVDFAQKRFAALVAILDETLDESQRKKVWERLGREHGREYRNLTDRYQGNLKGFLDDIRREWVETAEYDPAKGTIRIVDKSPVCTCPLVRRDLTPPSFCDCTLGWQKEVYSAVTGRPVEATLEESILRGGNRCVFRIQIL